MAHITTHAPTPTPTGSPLPPTRTRGVVVGWLLTAAALVAAGVLLLVVTSPGSVPEPAQTPNGSLNDLTQNPGITQPRQYAGWPAGVPQSADAAERWFAQQNPAPTGWPEGVPRSADAAERWFAQQNPAPTGWPEGVPHSADAAERWFANRQ